MERLLFEFLPINGMHLKTKTSYLLARLGHKPLSPATLT
jgi:hypothetical protein